MDFSIKDLKSIEDGARQKKLVIDNFLKERQMWISKTLHKTPKS